VSHRMENFLKQLRPMTRDQLVAVAQMVNVREDKIWDQKSRVAPKTSLISWILEKVARNDEEREAVELLVYPPKPKPKSLMDNPIVNNLLKRMK
jgi:hypothetical protein